MIAPTEYRTRFERDLLVMLSTAIGIDEACSLRVYWRYDLCNDQQEGVVGFRGKFEPISNDVLAPGDLRDHLRRLGDFVGRLVKLRGE